MRPNRRPLIELHSWARLCRNSASRAIFSTHSCPRMNCAHGTPTHGTTSPASARHGSDRACGLREGARAGARAKAGMGMWLTCGCAGRCTRDGRQGRAGAGAGAYERKRTRHHGRSNRCEHSSRLGMRAAAAKRQPSRINARASRPRPPRAGPRPTGRARRARRT